MNKIVIFATVVFSSSYLFLSCQKEQTYRLDIKDGVRYVHNLKSKNEASIIGLEFIQQIGELEPEDENYLFSFPISVAEDKEDNIYILDTKEYCVKKFTANGIYISRFGRKGQGPGDFGDPFLVDNIRSSWVANFLQIAVDSQDNIFIAFIHQNRIEKYSRTGQLLMYIDRTLPYELEYKYKKAKMEIQGKIREYTQEDFPQVNRGIGVDNWGRIQISLK